MKKLIAVVVLLGVLVAPSAMAFDKTMLPNLKAAVAYDFILKDLASGLDSDLLKYRDKDDNVLASLNVGYLASDTASIWIAGVSGNVGNLARKAHLDYGWANALETEIGVYGGYNFGTKKAHFGLKASLLKLEF